MPEWFGFQEDAYSDHLWSPFAFLAASPHVAGVLVPAVYLVFLVLWAPLRLVAALVGEAGTYALLLGAVYALGRLLATYLSYPGSFPGVKRDIEREFSRRLAGKLDLAVQGLAHWATDLRSGPPGGALASGHPSMHRAATYAAPPPPLWHTFIQRHHDAMWYQREVTTQRARVCVVCVSCPPFLPPFL